MKNVWGCEKKSPLPESARCEIEDGVMIIYENCIIKYIPLSIYKFIEIYNYYTSFPGAHMPEYGECSKRFIAAMHYYEYKKAVYKEERLKNG
jgi:hypothetical protein